MKSQATPARTSPCVTPWEGALRVVRFSCSDARAVGHDEDPFALMRRACFSRREEASRRREAHFSKLSQHGFKAEADVTGDVFEEDPPEGWTEFPGDPGDIRPEMAFIVGTLALSSGAEWLAGVSGKQGVEGSGEVAGIEGGDIVPDRGVGQVSGALGGNEGLTGICLPFDVAAGMEARLRETEAHIQAPAACAEGEAVLGTWHHVMPPPVS